MESITVLDVFHTSIGELALLTSPNEPSLAIGTILKRDDGATWKIVGQSWSPTLADLTTYKNFPRSQKIWGCKIEKQGDEFVLMAGQTLIAI